MTRLHRRRRSNWMLVLLLVLGAALGSAAGNAVGSVWPIAATATSVGMNPPATLDLSWLTLSIGGSLAVNLGTVVGVVLALVLYRGM